jgi:hypothetical protein
MKLLPDSLVEGTLKQAVDYLAERAATVRTEGHTWTEKQALGGSDILTGLGDLAKDPIVSKALIGGGIGGLAGGASHYFGGGEADPKNKRRGVLSSALTGALAGGALGGGIGAAQKYWPSEAAPPAYKGGKILDKGTVSPDNVKIDPEFLKANPDFAAKVEAAGAPSFRERAYHGLKGVGNVVADNPLLAGVAGGAGLMDLGTAYRNAAGLSRNPAHFLEGLKEHIKNPTLFKGREALLSSLAEGSAADRAAAINKANPGLFKGFTGLGGLKERLSGLLSRGGSLNPDAPVHTFTPPAGSTAHPIDALRAKLGPTATITPAETAALDALKARHPGPSAAAAAAQNLTREEARHISQTGFRALREKGLANKGLSTVGRLGLYGVPLAVGAADYFGGGATETKNRAQSMAEMFEQARQAGALQKK